MATRRCGYTDTTTGESCRNPVDPGSDHCAAGHPCVPLPPGAQASASSSPSGVGHDFEDLVALDTHGAESDDSIGAVKTSEVEDKGRIDAEVDALAMEAYLNNTYDDVILELRLAKYAEARLTDENKQLREGLLRLTSSWEDADIGGAVRRGPWLDRDEFVAIQRLARQWTTPHPQGLGDAGSRGDRDTAEAEVARLQEALGMERVANERARKVLERALIECDSLERGEAWWVAARNELGARITDRTPSPRPKAG